MSSTPSPSPACPAAGSLSKLLVLSRNLSQRHANLSANDWIAMNETLLDAAAAICDSSSSDQEQDQDCHHANPGKEKVDAYQDIRRMIESVLSGSVEDVRSCLDALAIPSTTTNDEDLNRNVGLGEAMMACQYLLRRSLANNNNNNQNAAAVQGLCQVLLPLFMRYPSSAPHDSLQQQQQQQNQEDEATLLDNDDARIKRTVWIRQNEVREALLDACFLHPTLTTPHEEESTITHWMKECTTLITQQVASSLALQPPHDNLSNPRTTTSTATSSGGAYDTIMVACTVLARLHQHYGHATNHADLQQAQRILLASMHHVAWYVVWAIVTQSSSSSSASMHATTATITTIRRQRRPQPGGLLRPILARLLPCLIGTTHHNNYKQPQQQQQQNKDNPMLQKEEQAWREGWWRLLTLLSTSNNTQSKPNSEELVAVAADASSDEEEEDGVLPSLSYIIHGSDNNNDNDDDEDTATTTITTKTRRCSEWNTVAPLVSLGILCVLFDYLYTEPSSSSSFSFSFSSATCTSTHTTLAHSQQQLQQLQLQQQKQQQLLHTTILSALSISPTKPHMFGVASSRSIAACKKATTTAMATGFGSDGLSYGDGEEGTMVETLTRRRAMRVLRLWVEMEEKKQKEEKEEEARLGASSSNHNHNHNHNHNQGSNNKKKQKQGETTNPSTTTTAAAAAGLYSQVLQWWKSYVACFEMLECEVEQHLIEQVWPTVAQLSGACATFAAKTRTRACTVTTVATVTTDTLVVDEEEEEVGRVQLPLPRWEWMGIMLSRVLLSDNPKLRKLGLHRVLRGEETGVQVTVKVPLDDNEDNEAPQDTLDESKPNKKKNKKKKKKKERAMAPLTLVDESFVLYVLLPSFDSVSTNTSSLLGSTASRAKNHNENDDDKDEEDDVEGKMKRFWACYLIALSHKNDNNHNGQTRNKNRLEGFLTEFLGPAVWDGRLRPSTLGMLMDTLADTCQTSHVATKAAASTNKNQCICLPLPLQQLAVERAVPRLKRLLQSTSTSSSSLSGGGMLAQHKAAILHGWACMLHHGTYPGNSKGDGEKRQQQLPQPLMILKLLNLFEVPAFAPSTQVNETNGGEEGMGPGVKVVQPGAVEMSMQQDMEQKTRAHLSAWLSNIGNHSNTTNAAAASSWSCTAGAACASSFVAGHLSWNDQHPMGTTAERQLGSAIARLCALGASTGAAAQLLWPAIHAGMRKCNLFANGNPQETEPAVRAVMLLEYGCLEGALGGMGNGEVVLLTKSKKGEGGGDVLMAPPPPPIEEVLGQACRFLVRCMEYLRVDEHDSSEDKDAEERDEDDDLLHRQRSARSGACRSKTTMPSRLAALGRQMYTIRTAFPSSVALSTMAAELLTKSLVQLQKQQEEDGESIIKKGMSLVHAVSCCFAALLCCGSQDELVSNASSQKDGKFHLYDSCLFLLHLPYTLGSGSRHEEQSCRSAFQVAKWGALSILIPKLLASFRAREANHAEVAKKEIQLVDAALNVATDAVSATPADALLPLFDCAMSAASYAFLPALDESELDDAMQQQRIQTAVDAVFVAMEDMTSNRMRNHMLDRICALLFRPKLLQDEEERHKRLVQKQSSERGDVTPIQGAFLRLMTLAGRNKPHVAKSVISRMCNAWLGNDGCGQCAIRYREEIAKLVTYKECRIDMSTAHQEVTSGEFVSFAPGLDKAEGDKDGRSVALDLPRETDEMSVVRGFILVFLSHLPKPPKSNDKTVTSNLDNQVLVELLHWMILHLLRNVCLPQPECTLMLMTGSAEYSEKIRAWQVLCLLSPYVTSEIAQEVCQLTSQCLGLTMHGQIRYFAEIFVIQCARRHATIFGRMLVEDMRRTDLSLQQVSSLMIVSGNLLVGRYQEEFWNGLEEKVDVTMFLGSVIPWLSSTQGFSRAIAQLLVYKLVDLRNEQQKGSNATSEPKQGEGDWFLDSLYNFLESNSEMARVRKKQTRFFSAYDVDHVCTLQGLLSIPVDEGNEASPVHMIDAIKQCLKEVYLEAHANDLPTWKQAEDALHAVEESADDVFDFEDESGAVNFQRKIMPLDMLDLTLEASREDALRNGAGRKKQDLIVCASLIDKVPNLGGLARTAEIFAANRLVVPDVNVRKMDNFKTISVSAGDWIQMEGCREENLLPWLYARKSEGYTIVGLEQTASSGCISKYEFPLKTVLLLGKEKEGIPVKFLHVVDVCVEIPQLGIIRSLNVHVTGAIAIWEYTKQNLG